MGKNMLYASGPWVLPDYPILKAKQAAMARSSELDNGSYTQAWPYAWHVLLLLWMRTINLRPRPSERCSRLHWCLSPKLSGNPITKKFWTRSKERQTCLFWNQKSIKTAPAMSFLYGNCVAKRNRVRDFPLTHRKSYCKNFWSSSKYVSHWFHWLRR